MMNKKQKTIWDFEDFLIFIFLLFVVGVFFIMTTIVINNLVNPYYSFGEYGDVEQTSESKLELYNKMINEIQENCGSVYITRQYGEDGWFVFIQVCTTGGYCKYDYIPLEDCL